MSEIIDGTWVLARLTGERGEKAKLARHLGIEPHKLSKSLTDERRFTPQEIALLQDWFSGNGAPEPGPAASLSDMALVAIYDVQASAGPGTYVEHEPVVERLAFPPNYLSTITSTNPQHLAIISVKGNSMLPTLKDGDVVMLDTSKRHLGYDGMFVLQIEGVLHVKRIGRTGQPGHVVIRSDNEVESPPYEVRIEDVSVVGRVLWSGRKE